MRQHLLAAALGFGVTLSGAVTPRTVEGPPDAGWRDGPVRYLLTRPEYDRYGRLETTQAREAYVARFWHRRATDSAGTGEEFRARFEARCAEANLRFQEGIGPGWRTDRGRILILLGGPDAVRRDAGEARGRDREIWTYANPPGGGGAALDIFFYRGESGAFTLQPEAIGGLAPDALARASRGSDLRRRLADDLPGVPAYDLERLVGLFTEPPTAAVGPEVDAERAAKRRSARTGKGIHATDDATLAGGLEEAAYFFQSADGSVLVVLAAGVPASPQPPPATVVAWISEKADPALARAPVEVPFARGSGPSDTGVFIGKAHLEPGAYTVRLAAVDEGSERIALRSFDLDVPELGSGRLAASSLVTAERFGPAPDGIASPFSVGSEEVVPRPSAAYRSGEPLRLYLQVYDAAVDPGTAKPRLDVQFRFERATRRGYRVQGAPLVFRGAEGGSIGLALPVGDWPVGAYRVAVQIDDRVSGSRTSSEASFTIAR